MSPQAMVASGHEKTSWAAATILENGGNAFDAIIAAGFASSVAEPALTSLGGGGFLLAWPCRERPVLFDFFSNTPGLGGNLVDRPDFFPVTVPFSGANQDFHVGMASAATPGVLKGFLHVHERLGILPLKEVIQPARELASRGVVLTHQQAHFLKLLEPIMTMTASGKKIFAPNGTILGEGERLVNQELASFLEELPRDRGRSFYQGELAKRVHREMEETGGLLTLQDLACFRVIERAPLAFRYRGHTILTNPPPSAGGSLIRAGLTLLSHADPASWEWLGKAHLHHLAESSRSVEMFWDKVATTSPIPPEYKDLFTENTRCCSRGTTHVTVADGFGNCAAMTTSNGEGSGYLVPGTGIMLNNMLGEDDLHPGGFHSTTPGVRVVSMMSPTMVLDGDKVFLALGSGGSKRIRTAITQVISHVVDFHRQVQEAVSAPRVHWDGATWQVEPGFAPEALDHLSRLGRTKVWPVQDVYFGGVHAVAPGRGCGGDPRRGGSAMVVVVDRQERRET